MKKLSLIAVGLFLALGVTATTPEPLDSSALPVISQSAQHATASKRIAATFTRSHYLPVQLDDALSGRIFDLYLKNLDYYRNHLMASDIADFEQYRNQFDDGINRGNLTFAFDMFNLAQQRRFERFDFALAQLAQDYDFAVNDEYVYDREDAAWPADLNELNELWRQRVKFDLLNLKLTGKTVDEAKEILTKRYKNTQKRLVQTQSEDVFQIVMNSFARAVEAHTSYLSPRNAERFQQEMNLQLEGIGAVLRADEDYTVIQSLVPGGPADLTQKIKPKDRIVGVAQEAKDFVDVVGWRLDDVVDLIKGPKGSKVRLQVLGGSEANSQTQVIEIVRDKIRLEDRAAKFEILAPKLSELQSKIGVINIPGFYNNLSEDVKKLLVEANEQKVDALIIDLRGNGGGSLQEATLLTGLFIDRGPVVQIRYGDGKIGLNGDSDGVSYYDGALTVLVDRYSASASEIFAAALQDYGRALIIGEQTFGKGTVQQHRGIGRIYDMFEQQLGSVQYTMAKFYRINGGSTQHKGVIPDITFPSPIDPAEWGESKEEYALPWDAIAPAQYQGSTGIQQQVPILQQKHQQRLAKETEFQYLLTDIAEYQQQKDEKSVSLNKAERIAKREADEARALARTNERLKRLALPAVTSVDDAPELLSKLDPFLEEAAHITVDWIQLNQVAKK
ncbi:carboxy terminal-processing peptidase [Alishewanella sp. SMS8]|uniref:carboxy terminal-processing peptidase n=1 Tax=Alishewanella sp. SMS8 TaxID=2994676 RepID=UPI002741FDD4|nr:carboxy terminal-processing peptidase [Alishewanella sp. SMS8]MDP5035921.1 carboxy terminal-processing peptidase [Alishewanella sp.]MDP5185682.1 carboxy terminal-processing peptidase [Alishewanella sp.]MDP5460754.1 carboxy terminal-processing peptidase [Alishewanella sp. SMS8]